MAVHIGNKRLTSLSALTEKPSSSKQLTIPFLFINQERSWFFVHQSILSRHLPPERELTVKNKISSNTLMYSKWSKIHVINKEKHFMVTKVRLDHQQKIIECIIEAVMGNNEQANNWRELKQSYRQTIGEKQLINFAVNFYIFMFFHY